MNGSDPKLSSQIPQIRILCLSLLAVWLLASYLTLLKLSVFQFPIYKMRRRIIPIKYACYENTIYIFKIAENKWWFIYHINKSIHSISLKKKILRQAFLTITTDNAQFTALVEMRVVIFSWGQHVGKGLQQNTSAVGTGISVQCLRLYPRWLACLTSALTVRQQFYTR